MSSIGPLADRTLNHFDQIGAGIGVASLFIVDGRRVPLGRFCSAFSIAPGAPYVSERASMTS